MNFANLMKQAQTMQRKVNKAKKEFNEKEFEITSLNDVVTGKMGGDLKIKSLNIDPSMLSPEHKEDLEDILLVAMNKIIEEVSQEKEDTLDAITGGVDVSAFL